MNQEHNETARDREAISPVAGNAVPLGDTTLSSVENEDGEQTRRTPALRIFSAVVVGHFGIDVFNSMGPVLLAFLVVPLGLSAAQVGLAVGLHQFLAGATQPFFGFLIDRIGSRWIGPLSVGWAIVLVVAAANVAPRVGFVWFLLIYGCAALGSGAFHPQGTMHAATTIAGRSATTTSIFFFCGQLGLSLGPILAGVALDRAGLPGLLWVALVFLPVPVFMARQMGSRRVNPPPTRVIDRLATEPIRQASPRLISLLALVFALRGWIFIGTAAFLPLLFQRQGWSASGQGLIVGMFWFGGGVLGMLAGLLADQWGRRAVVSTTTLAGALVLFFLPTAHGLSAAVLALVAGGLLGAPHSVLMVIAQDSLPWRRGLSSGLALGYLFAMGALASWGIGGLADRFPLEDVLRGGCLVGLLVSGLAWLLPKRPAFPVALEPAA